MDFDYKKHSLERLEEWVNDTLLSSEASPQEIYDVIKKATEENYCYFKHHTERCYELLALLNGNGKGHIQAYDEYAREWETDKTVVADKEENTAFFNVDTAGNMTPAYISPVTCDKDDTSPECKGAWNNFWEVWEEHYYPEEVKDDCMPPWGHSDMEYLIANRKKDEVKKWVLPVEEVEDADTGKKEYCITFPDDLLEAANLKEGNKVEWIDQGDGSYLIKKVENQMNYDEAIAAGWAMTDDGFWIKGD